MKKIVCYGNYVMEQENLKKFFEENKILIKGKLKLDTYELLGKDVKILLRSDTFGVQENEPKLKGNALFYKNDKIKSCVRCIN